MSLARIKTIFKQKGYKLFEKPYQLNIVGIRSKNTVSNSFDDEMHVFYKTDKGGWNYHVFPCTTDPGTFWLRNPMNPQGTAILQEGQYNSYALGLHKQQYVALVQVKPVTIIRDYDRDATLDFFNGKPVSGTFGLNIHRASGTKVSKTVDKYSAACQVLANPEDYATLMVLAQKHQQLHGNKFTYTLVDFRAERRAILRRSLYAVGALAIAGTLFYNYYYSEK